jgi:hypothetical protein
MSRLRTKLITSYKERLDKEIVNNITKLTKIIDM